jgi:AbrB family looped-hinge helix DNA binding protein
MRSSIDALGRLVVPKPIRDALGLRGGETLEVELRDGAIEMRPAPADVEIVELPEGPVATPKGELPPLDDTLVRDALEQVRR